MPSLPQVHDADDLESRLPSPEPLMNLFFRRADRHPDRVLSYAKIDGRWTASTWRQSKQAVEEIALGLLDLGVDRGTPVAILSATRREWVQIDLAIMSVGGIAVGLYPSLPGSMCRQLLEMSGARIVFVDEPAQRVKIVEATESLTPPITVVTFEPRAEGPRLVTLDELRRRGAKRRRESPEELPRRLREAKSSDIIGYLYTSGTTGEPKGAMLSHKNFHYAAHATNLLVPYENEVAIAFLPLAHSLQRATSYMPLVANLDVYFAESFEKVSENLREVHPTCFALVPRVLEKIHRRAIDASLLAPPLKRRVFERALDVLHGVGSLRREGRVLGLRERFAGRAADRILGQRVRDRLGGRVKFIGSGGAPLERDVHEFFEDVGIPILEGWGLTETSAAACVNTLGQRRIGTVGRPLPGTDIRIALDGEVLVRGPGLFSGYHQNDIATRDAFDDEGWFRTGDVGTMSRDGFLMITDRKKDLIVTSLGKNIAPQPLEGALKRSPLIAQAVVVGDRRPYLTALLGLDPDTRSRLAALHGLGGASPEAVADLPDVRAEIEAFIARMNAARPTHEQIKRYGVLPAEMTVETGELTPTLKVKRRVVTERYRALIEGLYA